MTSTNKSFVLVLESRPNNFEPINWNDSSICELETIDIFSSNFSEEEFRNFLVENNMIEKDVKDAPLQIIYNDRGIRRLSHGLLYKEDYNDNMSLYIETFLKDNINDSNLLNNIIQKIINERTISDYAKYVFADIFNNRKYNLNNKYYLLDRLYDCSYLDIRSSYFIIKREMDKKLDTAKLVLNKKSDEK